MELTSNGYSTFENDSSIVVKISYNQILANIITMNFIPATFGIGISAEGM